jgi:hypothetical protein
MILIRIETANAAFEDEPQEAARILAQVVDRLRDGRSLTSLDGRPLHDFNGNTVGVIEARSESGDRG